MRACVECGEEIGAKRLAYLPGAVRCVSCQEAQDVQIPVVSPDVLVVDSGSTPWPESSHRRD